jgi:hypothetical protein
MNLHSYHSLSCRSIEAIWYDRFRLPVCPRVLAILFFLMLSAGQAEASVHCVQDEAGLAAALASAADNGQHDEIRLRRGSYEASQPGQFEYITNNIEPFDLDVSGDWNSNCSQQGDNPSMTVISGNDVSRGLKMLANSEGADLSVRLLTFIAGVSAAQGEMGGGLHIGVADISHSSIIRVERNLFFANEAYLSGGLSVSGGAFQQVINNVFVANTAQRSSAASMVCRHAIGSDDHPGFGAFANNTIVFNEYAAPDAQTVYVKCGGGAVVANNNFDGNSGSLDLVFDALADQAGPFTLRNNNIHGHTPADVDENNIEVVPEYQSGFLDFTPVRSSPLVDAGITPGGALAFWYLTDFDFKASPREVGAHVDIGAFENEKIFVDGFELPGPFGLVAPRAAE